MRLSLLATILVVFFATGSWSHPPYQWIMDNPLTRHCCGPEDCKPIKQSSVRYDRALKQWFIRGKPVPSGSVYQSQVPEYYACFFDPPNMTDPRCLFIPGMS